MIAGGVVVAVLVVVYAVPRVMDWDRYRGQITALAAARLGRPVTIGGDVGLTILPQPVLTARRISVTDPVTGAVFTAREMRLRVLEALRREGVAWGDPPAAPPAGDER